MTGLTGGDWTLHRDLARRGSPWARRPATNAQWMALAVAVVCFFVPAIFVTLMGEGATPVEKVMAGLLLVPAGAVNAVIGAYLTSKLLALAVRSEDYTFIILGTLVFAVLAIAYVMFLSVPERPEEPPFPPRPMFREPEPSPSSEKAVSALMRSIAGLMLCGANLGAIVSALSVVVIRSTVRPNPVASRESIPSRDWQSQGEIPPEGLAAPVADPSSSYQPPPPPFMQTPQRVGQSMSEAVFTGSPPGTEVPATSMTANVDRREIEASSVLREAIRKLNSGQREEGTGLLQNVVSQYPGTKAARTAQAYLAKLGRG